MRVRSERGFWAWPWPCWPVAAGARCASLRFGFRFRFFGFGFGGVALLPSLHIHDESRIGTSSRTRGFGSLT